MTIFFRILALISAFLAIVFIAMPIIMMGHGSSPVRDIVASISFIAVGFLAMRCTVWLWRARRFWTEARSYSEVIAFTTFIILGAIVSFLEPRIEGHVKDALHICWILIVVFSYFYAHLRHKKNNAVVSP